MTCIGVPWLKENILQRTLQNPVLWVKRVLTLTSLPYFERMTKKITQNFKIISASIYLVLENFDSSKISEVPTFHILEHWKSGHYGKGCWRGIDKTWASREVGSLLINLGIIPRRVMKYFLNNEKVFSIFFYLLFIDLFFILPFIYWFIFYFLFYFYFWHSDS